MKINSKKELAVTLSKLKTFEGPDVRQEQYPTDSESAAEVLWFAKMQVDIEGKSVADLGCGTGILGIGAALLGAKKVYMVEIDEGALKIAKENSGNLKNLVFANSDVNDFNTEVNTVIQNPPFGVKTRHADRAFLDTSRRVAKRIYIITQSVSKKFVIDDMIKNGFSKSHEFGLELKLKASMQFHRKKLETIDACCLRFIR